MIGQIFKSNITKGFGDECVQSVESTSLTSLPFLLLNICIPPLRAFTSLCACNCRNGTYLSSSYTSRVLSSLYPSTISPLRVYFRHLKLERCPSLQRPSRQASGRLCQNSQAHF